MADQAEWHIVRFTVDAVFPADNMPSEYRREQIGRQLTENLHSTVVEDDDSVNMKVEKLVRVHVHDATERPCQDCNLGVYDDLNGDVVVEQSASMA